MIYINTKTPLVAIPRNEAKKTVTPRTQEEYARLLDELCRKEGKKGSFPVKHEKPPTVDYAERENRVIAALQKHGMLTGAELSEASELPRTKQKYVMQRLRNAKRVTFCHKSNKWSLTNENR